jgi:hypothetical protein
MPFSGRGVHRRWIVEDIRVGRTQKQPEQLLLGFFDSAQSH